VIFANAGLAQLAPFATVDEKFYDLHFDANVKGMFLTVQKALPLMKLPRHDSRIVFVPQAQSGSWEPLALE
jgi:NAD(P)-dependent dehydrogenase (short-subunit alcohol dehydrogenase family)